MNPNEIPMRPIDLIVPGRREAIAAHKCVSCGGPAVKFKDALSEREFKISGLCQKCQDSFFDMSDDCNDDSPEFDPLT